MAADRRNRLIGECVTAAQSSMDAAATAVAWSDRDDSETEVEILSGTRAARVVTAGERDGQAREVLSELRQRLERLRGLYPCEGHGRSPIADLGGVPGGDG